MIKEICCRMPILRPIQPSEDEPIWVICDTSIYGVGAREDKLVGYHIHVVTDHKALEFFKMQTPLTSRQTRWMDYLTRFDFDIRYVKSLLNKVVDALSRYFKHDYWSEVPELQDYVNADICLDPEHDDLPLECLFEVEEGVIESRVHRENSAKVVAEILALWERVQARDMLAVSIAASQWIRMQTTFKERDGFIWAQNRGGEDVLCIPSAPSGNTNLRTRILDQAHQVVGHYGPQQMADYIRCWYWWPGYLSSQINSASLVRQARVIELEDQLEDSHEYGDRRNGKCAHYG